ncbi:MAG: tetratricopeptide repeat protein [Actinomycetota bacterium]
MSTLDAEREFLLRSLDDLEAEYAAGNVDDATYESLHDDYTARAASVIRSLRNGVDPPLRVGSTAPRWVRAATVSGVLVFAVVAAFALMRAVGTREPGATITGNTEQRDSLDGLRAAAESRPDDYDAQIAYARAQLGNDLPEALRYYDAARRIDQAAPEPAAYVGWINGLAAQQVAAGPERDALVAAAFEFLDRAVVLDRTYADAYAFRALVNLNVIGDPAAAVADFQLFLANAPAEHPMRRTVNEALARAIEQSSTTPTGGP